MRIPPTADRRFQLHVLPQTPLGRWAIGLLVAGVALFVTTILLVNVGGQGGLWIAFTIIPAGVAVVGGGITAAVAIVRDHERGALVLIPLIVALALAWLLIGEIVAPH